MRTRGGVLLLMMVVATFVARAESQTPTRGPQDARSHIEVFLAFGDEASGRLAIVLEALSERHPTDLHIVFRHVTDDGDAAAALPHHAALAAHRQGRFWSMAHLLFANQDRHSREDVIGMARQLALDVTRFAGDLDDRSTDDALRADRARAAAVGITGPAVLLINGVRYSGEPTLQHIEERMRP